MLVPVQELQGRDLFCEAGHAAQRAQFAEVPQRVPVAGLVAGGLSGRLQGQCDGLAVSGRPCIGECRGRVACGGIPVFQPCARQRAGPAQACGGGGVQAGEFQSLLGVRD